MLRSFTTPGPTMASHPTGEDLSTGAPFVPANFAAFCSPNSLTIPSRNGGRWPAIPTFSASTAGTFCEELHELPKIDPLEIARFLSRSWPLVLLLLLATAAVPASATDAPRSFSLSTTRTFAPGESVKIQLYASNVPELEFRVYKVRDAEKFFAGLKDVHSFGVQSYAPARTDRPATWVERLHDFKAHLWWLMRHFFRGQFTDDARDSFREQQGKLGKRSQVVGAAQFAQIPLLNASQLVARWKLETPPAIVSETQQLPIDGLGAGVYLIEATDGTYKAYTVAIVTSIAVVERTEGRAGRSLRGRPQNRRADRQCGRCRFGRTGSCNRLARPAATAWLRWQ